MKYEIISQSEFEVTVKLESGKLFTVYSSASNPMDILVDLLFRETAKRVGSGVKMSKVLARSLEDTNVTFEGVA